MCDRGGGSPSNFREIDLEIVVGPLGQPSGPTWRVSEVRQTVAKYPIPIQVSGKGINTPASPRCLNHVTHNSSLVITLIICENARELSFDL